MTAKSGRGRLQTVVTKADDATLAVRDYAGVLTGAFALYIIPAVGVRKALPSHLILAAVVSVLSLAIALGVALLLRRSVKSSSSTVLIVGLFVAAVLGSLGAFAGTSATLNAWRPSSYSITAQKMSEATSAPTDAVAVSDPFGAFVDYYSWVLLDLIPGVDVAKTLKVNPTLEPVSVSGGLPVLGFKAYVIFTIIGLFKKWSESRKRPAVLRRTFRSRGNGLPARRRFNRAAAFGGE